MAADELVATAAAHWVLRFTANGTDYADVQATLSRITRWADWCREWGATAERYERLADQAEAAGHRATAGEAWRRAAMCWHWGKFVFTEDPAQQRAAHDRTVACYRRGAASLAPPARRVEIPYRGGTLAGYLRVPAAHGRPPVVLMVPGLDSVKEELQATAQVLVGRGLAVLAVDGPGQGEAEYDLPVEPRYEHVAAAAADFLERQAEVDAGRLGMVGVSLGGYYAARSAACEPRLVACVALSGPYQFGRDWDRLPPQTRAAFERRSFAAGPDQARDRALALNLADCAEQITGPLLVLHGTQDRLFPAYHAEQLAARAPGAELILLPGGNHGLTNLAFESRSLMADWLAARLGA
jgi:dipeptidyl aminopeptidase/acylaminoacyl peptidase